MQSLAEDLSVRATKKSYRDTAKPSFHSDETPFSSSHFVRYLVHACRISSSRKAHFVDSNPDGGALATPDGCRSTTCAFEDMTSCGGAA